MAFFAIFLLNSCGCESVDEGHKGVVVSWGGKTDMETILPEGMTTGPRWITDHVVQYDVREHTLVQKFSFNDNRCSSGIRLYP